MSEVFSFSANVVRLKLSAPTEFGAMWASREGWGEARWPSPLRTAVKWRVPNGQAGRRGVSTPQPTSVEYVASAEPVFTYLLHGLLPAWDHGPRSELERKGLLPGVRAVEDAPVLQLRCVRDCKA